MIPDHRTMSWWRVSLVVTALVSGCTKPNPKSCRDGTCTDPALPFCDVDGALSGEPETCIAVSCTPGEFEACRGDLAITCNTAGTSYDLIHCERGCDDALGGCRTCTPNETACTNGAVVTCDEAGNVISEQACPLGCFESEPRCRDIAPSNDLGSYLDMAADAPDLILDDGSIDTATGLISTGNATMLPPTFLVSNAGGPPIRVVVVASAHIRGRVRVRSLDDATSGPALAIVSSGPIIVDGRITVDGSAGGVDDDRCTAGRTMFRDDVLSGGIQQYYCSGGGGGGHATEGASGGSVTPFASGGRGGDANGAETLIPLRGGCPAGGVDDLGVMVPSYIPGGGAIQLSSRARVTINGVIDARGQRGYPMQAGTGGGAVFPGGGAGGGILIEAPEVTLGNEARLIVKGGAGAAFAPSQPSDDTAAPDRAPDCAPTDTYCGDGGNGAAPGYPAEAGASVAHTNAPSATRIYAGGGGGGMGWIRINTANGTYVKSNSTIEAGVVTTSRLMTR